MHPRQQVALAGAVAGLLLLGAGSWVLWGKFTSRCLPPLPRTLDEAAEVMTSPVFAGLKESEKRPYAAQAEKLRKEAEAADPEQLKAFQRKMRERAKADPAFEQQVRPAMEAMFLNMARDFVNKSPEERRQQIDTLINMMEGLRMMGPGRKGPGDDSAATGGDRPRDDPKRRAEFTEYFHERLTYGNPHTQAYASEFFKALLDRRLERGLPAYPPMPKRRD